MAIRGSGKGFNELKCKEHKEGCRHGDTKPYSRLPRARNQRERARREKGPRIWLLLIGH